MTEFSFYCFFFYYCINYLHVLVPTEYILFNLTLFNKVDKLTQYLS